MACHAGAGEPTRVGAPKLHHGRYGTGFPRRALPKTAIITSRDDRFISRNATFRGCEGRDVPLALSHHGRQTAFVKRPRDRRQIIT